MISRRIVRDIEEVGDAEQWCLDDLRRQVWKAAFTDMQGTDGARVTVVRCKYGFMVEAEL